MTAAELPGTEQKAEPPRVLDTMPVPNGDPDLAAGGMLGETEAASERIGEAGWTVAMPEPNGDEMLPELTSAAGSSAASAWRRAAGVPEPNSEPDHSAVRTVVAGAVPECVLPPAELEGEET